MIDKKAQGKKNRAAGQRFEKKVRESLELNGFICDRWTNNVELVEVHYVSGRTSAEEEEVKIIKDIVKTESRLVPAKPKFIFNPKTKSRQMIGNNSGFPDFVAFRKVPVNLAPEGFMKVYEVVGVESKINGQLDREEKEKCGWLLANNVFSGIVIASKGEKRGEIVYREFK